MRHLLALACLALPLGACAYDGYGYGYGARYGAPLAYDGYYDNYYGPIYDGYWGGGGLFYYRNRGSGRWRADRGGHFRHDIGPGGGFRAFHGNGPGPRAGGPGFRGGAGFHGGHGGGPHGRR